MFESDDLRQHGHSMPDVRLRDERKGTDDALSEKSRARRKTWLILILLLLGCVVAGIVGPIVVFSLLEESEDRIPSTVTRKVKELYPLTEMRIAGLKLLSAGVFSPNRSKPLTSAQKKWLEEATTSMTSQSVKDGYLFVSVIAFSYKPHVGVDLDRAVQGKIRGTTLDIDGEVDPPDVCDTTVSGCRAKRISWSYISETVPTRHISLVIADSQNLWIVDAVASHYDSASVAAAKKIIESVQLDKAPPDMSPPLEDVPPATTLPAPSSHE
jgi:hypothetical protein